IGQSVLFSLGGCSPHVQTRFHVPRLTHFHTRCPFAYRAITVYGRPFQVLFLRPLGNTIYIQAPYITTREQMKKVYDSIKSALTIF
ncbi:MAG TPA: hypothetical protein VLZ54_06215, partial [Arenibacter sp.]|nr:hypothetical protein [Arenibacter sp.]